MMSKLKIFQLTFFHVLFISFTCTYEHMEYYMYNSIYPEKQLYRMSSLQRNTTKIIENV